MGIEILVKTLFDESSILFPVNFGANKEGMVPGGSSFDKSLPVDR